jgi:hypothetical protein
MGFEATFELKGYGDKPTVVTEYFCGDTASEVLAALKETYGDKLSQVFALSEQAGCECNDGCCCG